MPAFQAPLCRKCQEKHYNIMTCEKHAEKVKYEEDHRVIPAWRSGKPWGDNLPSFNRAGNTFWRKKT